MKLTKTQLLNHLEQFIGTEYYYPLWPKVLLTDGTRFLADTVGCYWLMDAIASHVQHLDKKEVFTSCKLKVLNGSAELIIDDGNGNILATQKIPCTDFPLDSMCLYACLNGDKWIILLPSEY
jgi:hypothetical protein